VTRIDPQPPGCPATAEPADGTARDGPRQVADAIESLDQLVVQHRRGDDLCPNHVETVVAAASAFAPEPVLARFAQRATIEHRVFDRATDPPGVVVNVLGVFECAIDGQPVERLTGTVVALLSIVAAHDIVAVEVVIDALWPDADEQLGRRRLRNVISRARKLVGARSIVRTDGWLELGSGVTTDRHRFQTRASKAMALLRENNVGAGPAIVDALDHYRGPFLPGRPYWEWASTRRIELHTASVGLFDALLRDPRHRPPAAWSLDVAARMSIQDPTLYVLIAGDAAAQCAPVSARAAITAAEMLSAELDVELAVPCSLSTEIERLARSPLTR